MDTGMFPANVFTGMFSVTFCNCIPGQCNGIGFFSDWNISSTGNSLHAPFLLCNSVIA
jgi:hypothetical protein